MSEVPESKPVRIPRWLWAGSAFWLIGVFSFAWFVFWPNVTGGFKPNEFGDLLAGAFSPLAFAWFVYAVFMQKDELELQRMELTETREVLEKTQKSQEDNAKETTRLANETQISNKYAFKNIIDKQILLTKTQFCAVMYVNRDLLVINGPERYTLWSIPHDVYNQEIIYQYDLIKARLIGSQYFSVPDTINQNYIHHFRYILKTISELAYYQNRIIELYRITGTEELHFFREHDLDKLLKILENFIDKLKVKLDE